MDLDTYRSSLEYSFSQTVGCKATNLRIKASESLSESLQIYLRPDSLPPPRKSVAKSMHLYTMDPIPGCKCPGYATDIYKVQRQWLFRCLVILIMYMHSLHCTLCGCLVNFQGHILNLLECWLQVTMMYALPINAACCCLS